MAHVVFAAMLLACLPFGAGYHQWDVRLAAYHQIEFVSEEIPVDYFRSNTHHLVPLRLLCAL